MKTSNALFVLSLLLAAGAAQAESVWKWTGQDGKTVYGQQPPNGVKAERVEVQTNKGADFGGPVAIKPAPAVKSEAELRAAATTVLADGSTVVDASKIPGVKKYKPGETPFCPPIIDVCKRKQSKGDYPWTPDEPHQPTPDGKGGYLR